MAYGDVDLNLLIVLDRLLARQSVTEAAADLGLSASATSRALQRLRDALGDPLLHRAGNRLVPTELARDLIGPAGRAVEAAREVFDRERTFDPTQASGDFVLALTPWWPTWLPTRCPRRRRVPRWSPWVKNCNGLVTITSGAAARSRSSSIS